MEKYEFRGEKGFSWVTSLLKTRLSQRKCLLGPNRPLLRNELVVVVGLFPHRGWLLQIC
jgi:hypothetical protein